MKNSKKTIKKFKNDIKAREAVYQNDLKEMIKTRNQNKLLKLQIPF